MNASGSEGLVSGSSTAPDTYEYAPLSGKSFTRIIELFSKGVGRDELISLTIHEISLETESQQTRLPYTAVSYAWEGQKPAHRVICDGKGLEITPTVLHYLQHERQKLRTADESNSYFWVDAISIDQAKTPTALAERASQVSMMHMIFSRAEKADVWMGPRRDVDDYVIMFIRPYCSITPEEFLSLDQSPVPYEAFLKALGLPDMSNDFWDKFSTFIDRPWFFRLWIMQEFALAKDICFKFGEREISEKDLTTFFKNVLWQIGWFSRKHENIRNVGPLKAAKMFKSGQLQNLSDLISRGTNTVAGLSTAGKETMAFLTFQILEDKRNVRQRYPLTETSTQDRRAGEFCQHFADTVHFKSTDTRDRVYALTGLSEDRDAPELAVDYTEDTDQLSERVTEYMFKKGFGATCLLRYSQATWKDRSGWRLLLEAEDVYRKDPLSLQVSDNGACNLFNAAPGTALGAIFFSLPNGRKRLAIKGRVIGIISDKNVPFFSIDSEFAESLSGKSQSHGADPALPIPESPEFKADEEVTAELIEVFSTIMPESEAKLKAESFTAAAARAAASLSAIFDPTGQTRMKFKSQLNSFCEVSRYIQRHANMLEKYRELFEFFCWRTIATNISISDPSRLILKGGEGGDDDTESLISTREASRKVAAEDPSVYTSWDSYSIASLKVRDKHPNLISAMVTFGNFLKQSGGKVLAVLESGWASIPFPCLLPPNCAEGDVVCVLNGCALPVLTRPLPCDEYMYMGPCYVSAYMDGLALMLDEGKHHKEQDFVLLPGDENS